MPSRVLTFQLEKAPYSETCTTVDLKIESAPSPKKKKESKVCIRTGNLECGQIIKILPIDASPTKYVNDITYKGSSVSFTWRRSEAYTLKFCPFPSAKVERPSVVVVVFAICTAKAVQEEMR